MRKGSRGGGAGSEAVGLPFLRFYHSKALRTRTLSVLEALETEADPTSQRTELAEVVLALTEAGLDYYFVKAVVAAKVGFMAEKSTRFGVSSFLRVMGPVARRVIGGMNAQQLLTVSKHIRHLME